MGWMGLSSYLQMLSVIVGCPCTADTACKSCCNMLFKPTAATRVQREVQQHLAMSTPQQQQQQVCTCKQQIPRSALVYSCITTSIVRDDLFYTFMGRVYIYTSKARAHAKCPPTCALIVGGTSKVIQQIKGCSGVKVSPKYY